MQSVSIWKTWKKGFLLGFEGLTRSSFSEANNYVVNLLDQAQVEDRYRVD
jgi:hypothetical protein